jgi:hypothetical protein
MVDLVARPLPRLVDDLGGGVPSRHPALAGIVQ